MPFSACSGSIEVKEAVAAGHPRDWSNKEKPVIRMTLDEVRELAVRILRRHAFSEAHVQAVADTLVAGA